MSATGHGINDEPSRRDSDETAEPATVGQILAEYQHAQRLAESTYARWAVLPQSVRAQFWSTLDDERREALAYAARASDNPLAWFDDLDAAAAARDDADEAAL